jgi:metal-sulfur cluster biosynthetic enzyme
MEHTCFSRLYFLLGVVATMTVGGCVLMALMAHDVSQCTKRFFAQHDTQG